MLDDTPARPTPYAPVHATWTAASPRPTLHQRVPPTDQVPLPHFGSHFSQLSLSRSMNLLDVVEDLLHCRAGGHRLEDRCHSQILFGREILYPSSGLAHQHHTDHPTHRFVGRQGRLVLLHHQPAVEGEKPGLPAPCSGASGQVDPVLAVLLCRPRPYYWPGSTTGGNDHKAASHRSRLITVTPAASTRFKNGLFVSPVGDHPDRRVGGPQLLYQPLDLGGGQLQLGVELPSVVGRHPA